MFVSFEKAGGVFHMEDIMAKLKLDRHHKMERFGVLFFCLILAFGVLLTTIWIKKTEDDKVTLGTQVMYTSEFTSSKSGLSGSVQSIYCSDDRTKVFLLLRFNDINSMSLDAKNYRLFLSGSDLNKEYKPLLSTPSGGIYMFGSTGYMGIYLVESRGFPEQIQRLIVRNLSEFGSVETDYEFKDSSFEKYDQFTVYFNPGGADYTTIPSLNEGDMDVFSLYADAVTSKSEAAIRETLDESLSSMQTQLALIEEYEQRLYRDEVAVPDAPDPIRGDEITVDEDGNLSLDTDFVVAGGYDFDWRSGSIKEGYLDDLTNGKTAVQFLTEKQSEGFTEMSVARLAWYDLDGNLIDTTSTGNLGFMATIQNDIQTLTEAWNAYFQMKQEYQRTQLESLLMLELNSQDVQNNATLNTAEDALTLF